MAIETLTFHSQNHDFISIVSPPALPYRFQIHSQLRCIRTSRSPSSFSISTATYCRRRSRFITACVSPEREFFSEGYEVVSENAEIDVSVSSIGAGDTENVEKKKEEFAANESIWSQIVEIVKFSGPAVGLWLCAPLMSLIDTAVIGQGSSIELAALGPATVICDYTSYVFMFLSIATSNLVATALARQDKDEVQHQISILLFIGLVCGVLMLFFTRFLGAWTLTVFTGAKNLSIIPAANTYVQIRGLGWPAVLVGWVAQSASLGMKDSWGPLKALAVASAINGVGDVILCTFLGYGIAGAAWATLVSQVVAAYIMIEALNKKGYNGFAISVPSPSELLQIFMLAAPLFVTMMSRVAFYALLVYFATSMNTHSVAAHQVMIQMYCMCSVWGEPLSQTAQSYMPELIYGVNRSLPKARLLLKSLVTVGALSGAILGLIGTSIPWFFPQIFTSDTEVVREMHKVLIPYFLALFVTPCTNSLEGTLLAGRDLNFLSSTMSGLFCLGAFLLWHLRNRGWGLPGCWIVFVAFQWSRLFIDLQRLLSPDGLLFSDRDGSYSLPGQPNH